MLPVRLVRTTAGLDEARGHIGVTFTAGDPHRLVTLAAVGQGGQTLGPCAPFRSAPRLLDRRAAAGDLFSMELIHGAR